MIPNMINMRRIHMMSICLLCISVELCTATPIRAQAGKICRDKLTQLMKMPLAKRKLSNAESARLIEMADTGGIPERQCACLALAFAGDADSLEMLKKLAKDRRKGAQAAANYALKVRQNAGRKPREMLNNLCFWLGRSEDPVEKMFLANRMWVDFGEESVATILLAAKDESEGIQDGTDRIDAATMMKNMVCCDLLYYLSESTSERVLREALELKWDEEVHWTLPGDLVQLMGSVTPGRPSGTLENSRIMLVDKIRAKLGEGK